MNTYENRVIAFLDILGFKDWIAKIDEPQNLEIIKKAVDYIANVRYERYHGFFPILIQLIKKYLYFLIVL